MPRLEIEIGARNSGQIVAAISNVDKALAGLDARYAKLSKKIQEASFTANELEGELNNLNSALKAGTISQAAYSKESEEIKSALGSARQSLSTYQAQLLSVTATTRQITQAQEEAAKSTKKLETHHKSFSTGIRSTNTLSVEFARTLSDLPYGMQGVGNNLQQLTQNWAYYAQAAREAAKAQGTTVTTGQLLKGAFASMLSPINLLTIGVSLITAGWVAYEKYQQKATKSAEEAAKSVKTLSQAVNEYIETLSASNQAEIQSSKAHQQETIRLTALRTAIEDTNTPMKARLQGVKELKKEFPGYFEGISNEVLLNGRAGKSYEALTQQIIASAKARAYSEKLADSALLIRGLEEQEKNNRNVVKTAQERLKAIDNEINSYLDIEARNARITKYANERKRLENDIVVAAQKVNESVDQRVGLLQEDQILIEGINEYTKKGLELTKEEIKVRKSATKELQSYGDKIREVFNPDINPADTKGLSTGDAETEKTRQKYAKMYMAVDGFWSDAQKRYKQGSKELLDAEQAYFHERAQIAAAEADENVQNAINEVQRIAREVERIRSESGIKAAQDRQKELLQLDKWYDDEIRKAEGNADLKAAVEEGFRAQKEAINAKYDAKEFAEFSKIVERMNRNRTQGLIEQLGKETELKVMAAKGDAKLLEQIAIEYSTRLAEIQKRGQLADSYNGELLGQQFAQINEEILQVRNNFKDGIISQDQFESSILRLNELKGALEIIQSTSLQLGDTFANVFTDILFDTDNVLRNIVSSVKRMVSDIIKELIRISIVKGITALLTGGSSLAFKGFGGYASGGYTGNISRNRIAGFVHGQEYVVKAGAARRNMPLLEAINNGSLGSIRAGSVGTGGTTTVITPVVDISMDRLVFAINTTQKKLARNG